jgi:GxxExxY protein
MIVDLIYKEEVYNIIGLYMEVHRLLGKGFSEIVYKDAIEYECQQKELIYNREKEFLVHYKSIILPHKYFADFVVLEKIILEVKSCEAIAEGHIGQTLNYLAASKLKVGLIVNFGKNSLEYKELYSEV